MGCLSFEERCRSAPLEVWRVNKETDIRLFTIVDPPDAFPDFSDINAEKTDGNHESLLREGLQLKFEPRKYALLATEDTLLDLIDEHIKEASVESLYILDITSFPKRYFCFLLKHMLRASWCSTLLVTYTSVGDSGYTTEHLTADPMTVDHLPGYLGSLVRGQDTLVISLGFEMLNLRSLLEVYHEGTDPKILMSYPSSPFAIRRQWDILRQMFAGAPMRLRPTDIESVAVWDAAQVYRRLHYWKKESDQLTLAPFGTKPHSLGMALYALEMDAGMYYSQPKSYNPDYSGSGAGEIWGYLAKFEGVTCFGRD